MNGFLSGVYFWQSFWHLKCKKILKKCMSIHTHTHTHNLTRIVTREKKMTSQLTFWKLNWLVSNSNESHANWRTQQWITNFFENMSHNNCKCKLLDVVYVKKVFHALNDHFPNLPIFNVAICLDPHCCPIDDSVRTMNIELWLKIICWSFSILQKKATCVREEFCNLQKHFDMSVRTKQCLGFGMW